MNRMSAVVISMNWIRQYHLGMFSVIQGILVSVIIFNYILTDRFGNIYYLFSHAIWLDRFSYSIYLLDQLIWLIWFVLLSSFGIWMNQKWGWWIAVFYYTKNVFFSLYACMYYLILATPLQQIPITNKFKLNRRLMRMWKLRNLAIAASLPVFTVFASLCLSVFSS